MEEYPNKFIKRNHILLRLAFSNLPQPIFFLEIYSLSFMAASKRLLLEDCLRIL